MKWRSIIVSLLVSICTLLSFLAQGQVLKDSIYYSPDTTLLVYWIAYDSVTQEIEVINRQGFSVAYNQEDVYTHQTDGKLYYYQNTSTFKLEDSIFVHGEVCLADTQKPNEELVGKIFPDNRIDIFYPYEKKYVLSCVTRGKCYKGLREGMWTFDKVPFSKVMEHYKTGIRDGEYTVYTKQDSILYQTNFDKGTGEERIYRDSSENYSLYHIKYFKDGKQDYSYPLKEFYSRGTLARFVDYKNGIEEEYYLNEKPFLRTEGDFELGENQEMVQKKGKKFYFDRKGNKVRTDIFNEKETTSIHYDDKGKIKKIHSGNMVQHFKKGKLQYTFIEGQKLETK